MVEKEALTLYEYMATIDRVVDGDTVDMVIDQGFHTLRKQRCRVAGIDTPEVRTRDPMERKYGIRAYDRVCELLQEGVKYHVRIDRLDKYGRALATIHVDHTKTLASILIEERLAVRYDGQNKDEIRAAHRANWAYLEQEK